MHPAAAALQELLAALKEGEYYDEHNRETCYLVTRSSVALARAKAVALFDSGVKDPGPAQPLMQEAAPAPVDAVIELFRLLD
jgi:hypothetical protein